MLKFRKMYINNSYALNFFIEKLNKSILNKCYENIC